MLGLDAEWWTSKAYVNANRSVYCFSLNSGHSTHVHLCTVWGFTNGTLLLKALMCWFCQELKYAEDEGGWPWNIKNIGVATMLPTSKCEDPELHTDCHRKKKALIARTDWKKVALVSLQSLANLFCSFFFLVWYTGWSECPSSHTEWGD